MAYVLHRTSCCRSIWESRHSKKLEPETKLVCKYNVTSISEPTVLRTNYELNIFKSMEIDGVMLDELVTFYKFDTTGVHTVKYELYDNTKLGNSAPVFEGNLIEVIIPDSVTNIGDNAFSSRSGLTNVVIGNGVISIGTSAFSSCIGLTSINIPDSVASIGANAFAGCTGLASVTIGSGVTSIGQSAFQSCTSLTSITIPNSVTSIGNQAFCLCTGLTSITIGNSVTSIDTGAFGGCTGLASIVSNGITAPTISNNTFKDVKTDGTLTVPAGSTGYDVWIGTDDYYLGKYNWTKVEQ